jgi:hypothetical protein
MSRGLEVEVSLEGDLVGDPLVVPDIVILAPLRKSSALQQS